MRNNIFNLQPFKRSGNIGCNKNMAAGRAQLDGVYTKSHIITATPIQPLLTPLSNKGKISKKSSVELKSFLETT